MIAVLTICECLLGGHAQGGVWHLVTADSGWTFSHGAAVNHEGSLVIAGGESSAGFVADVWSSSTGGETWTCLNGSCHNATPGWVARRGHAMVSHNGSLILAGGMQGTSTGVKSDGPVMPFNDVWCSWTGGRTWTLITAMATWKHRQNFAMVSHLGNLVIAGGRSGGLLGDVWLSNTDGETWTRLTPEAEWPARWGHAMVSHHADLILIGGCGAKKVRYADVWRSNDNGMTWTSLTQEAPWANRNQHTLVSHESALVLAGGLGYDGFLRDVWASLDGGRSWSLLMATPPWNARYGHSMVSLGNTLVMVGGVVVTSHWEPSRGISSEVWNATSCCVVSGMRQITGMSSLTSCDNLDVIANNATCDLKCDGGYLFSGDLPSCALGRFGAGSMACKPCSMGYFSPQGSDSCKICGAGKYSMAGSAACTNCPVGRVSRVGSGILNCTTCSGGRFAQPGSSECQTCPSGTISAASMDRCNRCEPGKMVYPGDFHCASCSAGLVPNEKQNGCEQPRCAAFEQPSLTEGQDCELNTGLVASFVISLFLVNLILFATFRRRAQIKRNRLVKKELQKMRNKDTIATSIKAMHTLEFPMVIMHAQDFLGAEKLTSHEVARENHSLLMLDTVDSIIEFESQRTIVFFSHQWLAFSEPDPGNVHYECMKQSLIGIAQQVDGTLGSAYVWADYTSIPQIVRATQKCAIISLPIYASLSSCVAIVAPDTTHLDLKIKCSLDTYATRTWCRVECLSHYCHRGVEDMYVSSDEDLGPVKDDWLENLLMVFEGDCTCCRLQHKGMPFCDKELLVVPVLALYIHVLIEKQQSSVSQHVSDVVEFIEKHKDRMFPRSFASEFVDDKKGVNVGVLQQLYTSLLIRCGSKIKRMLESCSSAHTFGMNGVQTRILFDALLEDLEAEVARREDLIPAPRSDGLKRSLSRAVNSVHSLSKPTSPSKPTSMHLKPIRFSRSVQL